MDFGLMRNPTMAGAFDVIFPIICSIVGLIFIFVCVMAYRRCTGKQYLRTTIIDKGNGEMEVVQTVKY
jgi:hypothetical protein